MLIPEEIKKLRLKYAKDIFDKHPILAYAIRENYERDLENIDEIMGGFFEDTVEYISKYYSKRKWRI